MAITSTDAFLAIWCTLAIVHDTASSKDQTRRHSRERDRIGGTLNGLDEGVCELEISCKNDDFNPMLPVRLPIRGPRGPAGLKGEPGEPGKPATADERSRSELTEGIMTNQKRIAFFAGLAENLGPVNDNRDVIFDRIITNVGSAYNVTSGRFTSPVNGTYQFNVVISAQGRQKAAVMMAKNGGMVATTWAESIPFWASASNTAILSLEEGDQVWLLLLSRASYLHGYMYTTFSGFLIFENN